MSSISNTLFMIKYDFFKKEDIPQYAIVKIITIINMACLIEDIKTLKRTWVMKYDIYPLNNNNLGGYWEYSKIHDEIAIEQGLK
jgi:hypothetical protein